MYESLITNDAIRAGKIGKKVALFGAGEYGRIFIDRHKGNIAVSCFIDNGAADGSKCMYILCDIALPYIKVSAAPRNATTEAPVRQPIDSSPGFFTISIKSRNTGEPKLTLKKLRASLNG